MNKITVTYEKLINLGNYENVKVGAQITMDVEKDDIEESLNKAYKECRKFVKEKGSRVK